MANPDLTKEQRDRLKKPKKGTARIARITARRSRVSEETANKTAAKKRDDYRCQRPRCPHCEEYGRQLGALQGAHWQAKGMGGDKKNLRSQRKHFITLDPISHQEFEHHELVIEPVDPRLLMDGPRRFYRIVKGKRVFEGTSGQTLWRTP